MEANKNNSMLKGTTLVALGTILILSIPLVAMQFTTEVDWSLGDFIIIGALLFGTGLIYVLAAQKIHGAGQRAVIAAILIAALLLTWAELAVGIFGTPFAGS